MLIVSSNEKKSTSLLHICKWEIDVCQKNKEGVWTAKIRSVNTTQFIQTKICGDLVSYETELCGNWMEVKLDRHHEPTTWDFCPLKHWDHLLKVSKCWRTQRNIQYTVSTDRTCLTFPMRTGGVGGGERPRASSFPYYREVKRTTPTDLLPLFSSPLQKTNKRTLKKPVAFVFDKSVPIFKYNKQRDL